MSEQLTDLQRSLAGTVRIDQLPDLLSEQQPGQAQAQRDVLLDALVPAMEMSVAELKEQVAEMALGQDVVELKNEMAELYMQQQVGSGWGRGRGKGSCACGGPGRGGVEAQGPQTRLRVPDPPLLA